MDKQTDRREKIITLLKQKDVSSIMEMSKIFNVSLMTIRRDLQFLTQQERVRLIHGGAIYNPIEQKGGENSAEYLLQKQKLRNKEEKHLIAKHAVTLIHPQDTIMLDSGTTIYYLAREIPMNQQLTAISWSLNIIEELIKKTQSTMLVQGGVYHPETQMFENLQGMEMIKTTRASKAFISAGGFHTELGITCPFHYEVETKRAAIKSSMTKILMIDSSKFGKVRAAHMAEANEFDIIITDSGIPPEYREFIEKLGIELILADPAEEQIDNALV
jgi:DeoR family deoxyribose operon repressor